MYLILQIIISLKPFCSVLFFFFQTYLHSSFDSHRKKKIKPNKIRLKS